MHLTFNNVTHAFHGMVSGIDSGAIKTVERDSRNGPVLKIPEPVIITYEHPRQRVLMNPFRDANPFFHLYESLWMLMGRDDVESLSFFSSKISQFSDDGKTFNGAYGKRWCSWMNPFGSPSRINQLDVLVNHLKKSPDSRRTVLQMWDPLKDLIRIDEQYNHYSKDVCCNLAVKFSTRGQDGETKLDMTVYNRSNDLILGMFGANVVHFSFLQEYVAGKCGFKVGKYHQISDDLHVYKSNWFPSKWLSNETDWVRFCEHYPTENELPSLGFTGLTADVEVYTILSALVESTPKWGNVSFKTIADHRWNLPSQAPQTKFLTDTALPMLIAFALYKQDAMSHAIAMVNTVESPDWRVVGQTWLWNRWEKRRAKQGLDMDPYAIRAELEVAEKELNIIGKSFPTVLS